MRQSIFLLALLILSCHGFSQKKKDRGSELPVYPSFSEMSKKLSNTYDMDNLPENQRLNFEKHPDGWFIRIDHYENQNISKAERELYWKAATNSYQEIDLLKRDRPSGDKFLFRQGEGYEQQDRKYFYFGYRGCHWDAIQALKDKKKFTDQESYYLARAYSAFANGFVGDYRNTALPEHQFSLGNERNSMTTNQLAKFRKYNRLAIEYFEKTRELNPDFETFIGSLDIKIGNVHMERFLTLWTHQNEKEALKDLPDDLYPDYMRAVAHNYLASCPKNAILFTNGDNDTYPLLYVQAKENLRPDVTIVNFSMLQVPKYAMSFSDGAPFGALPVATSFKIDDLNDSLNTFWYILPEDTNAKALSLATLVEQGHKQRKYFPSVDLEAGYVSSYDVYFDFNDQRLEWNFDEPYILRSTMLVYDIILNNHQKRPICFSFLALKILYCDLEEYLNFTGSAYVLQGKNENGHLSLKENLFGHGYTQSDLLYENMMKKFKWVVPKKEGVNALRTNSFSQSQFTILMEALMAEEKHDRARKVIGLYLSTFAKAKANASFFTTRIAHHAYDLDLANEGREIASQILINSKEEFFRNKENSMARNEYRMTLSSIRNLAYLNNDEALQKMCEKYRYWLDNE